MNISVLFCPLDAATPAENELQSPVLPACKPRMQELTQLILGLQRKKSESAAQTADFCFLLFLSVFSLPSQREHCYLLHLCGHRYCCSSAVVAVR